MHDLLRAYARELAAAHSADDERTALTRLFDYYLHAVAVAMDTLFLQERQQRPSVSPTAAAVPAMRDAADARAWLDAERANLVAVIVHCDGHGWPRHPTALAGTLHRYLMTGSHLSDASTIYGRALHAARESGDPAGAAGALNGLGGIDMMRGHFRGAAGHYQAALESYRKCGDRAARPGSCTTWARLNTTCTTSAQPPTATAKPSPPTRMPATTTARYER